MGGTLSLWLARARPTDFPAVFALAPASRPRPIRFLVPFFLTVDRLFPRLVNQFVVTRLWRRTLYWDDIVTPEASRELWRPMQHPETGPIFLRATSTVFDQRLPKALADIKSKVFLFWGEEERIVPESEILEAHRWIKNSELIKIPQASHHPMEDQPVEIANQILRHRHLCPPSHANTSTARQGL
jgi:pimeloyl-ACP methyl ester carboxylesterase